ncbi:argininosuccinate lyase [Siculibacillus lacustris]|uniref:Argininosuccinate lyase n=1 Tax=Siculibacillus lacustris TaxID=1549641 RepID=A0A4Q9VH39_9HYPH|nr:argininosuccinate lyase [Siculibacillus lacustris]TBW33873.1 argininosuccinate lyase [Siculibacillus lacustris]
MKAVVWAFGLAIAAMSVPVTSAVAAEAKQNFVLVNKTGYEINAVFVSPAKSNDWEEDVLGQDTLSDGESLKIRFQRSAKTCKWDLKVVYAVDDSNAVWSGIDLCTVAKVTIRYNKKTDTTTASFD